MSENAEKATGFLKVLCILTIIGSAHYIYSSLFQKEDAVVEVYGWYYWVMLLLAVGTLYGALQMMKLKKWVSIFIRHAKSCLLFYLG